MERAILQMEILGIIVGFAIVVVSFFCYLIFLD